jgi:hypothetical protein
MANSVLYLSMLSQLLVVVSVALDAKRHGAQFVWWGLAALVFPLLGAAGWLAYRALVLKAK